MLKLFSEIIFWGDAEEDDATDDAPNQKGIRLSLYTEGAESALNGMSYEYLFNSEASIGVAVV